MPDVARSRSFRDETSDRRRRDKQERPSHRNGGDDDDDDDGAAGAKLPRSVSFNRDVRIKRIGPRETSRTIPALTAISPLPVASNGSVQQSTARPFVHPVRRERLRHLSEKQLADEAAHVLKQVGRINCVSEDNGVVPEKFYSLPNRGKKHRANKIGNGSPTSSIDRKPIVRRRSEEIGATTPGPKKPPRTFLSRSVSVPKRPHRNPSKNSLATLFKREPDVNGTVALKRSKSDVSQDRTRYNRTSKRIDGDKKTQLSPIIETSQADDYFDVPEKKKTQQSERMIVKKAAVEPDVVVIDVERAEKIAKRSKRAGLRETFRSLTGRGKRSGGERRDDDDDEKENARPDDDEIGKIVRELQETVRAVEESDKMIHGGRKPVERMHATRGHRVDDMVRRLSRDKFTPPPRTGSATAVVSPTPGMQHNNNRPFSYTKPSSPECASYAYVDDYPSGSFADYCRRSSSPEIGPSACGAFDKHGQVIYAQVVCGGAGDSADAKKTVHASYASKRTTTPPPHNSDSDEGLGYEETKWRTHDDDDETPIRPKYTHRSGRYATTTTTSTTSFADIRGRADGMDAIKRRDSVTERADLLLNGGRGDLSSRREQLESRINSRTLQRRNPTQRTEQEVFERRYTSESSFCRDGDVDRYTSSETRRRDDAVAIDEPLERRPSGDKCERSYRSNRATKYVAQSERLVRSREKEHHRSNPELIVQQRQRRHDDEDRYGSYHDSLRRQQRDTAATTTTTSTTHGKERFVDSGIENDFRRDSGENVRVVVSSSSAPPVHESDEEEDEGFASSLLIASERQHTEENVETRRRAGVERGRGRRGEYVPRERSIDDGSHFDPRIDRDVDGGTLKRVVDKKPPKVEKKISGLDKVRNLFSSKKTKEKRKAERLENEIMVKEEEMRARYREYKGSTEQLDVKTDVDHSGRKRLATPRSSPTPSSQRKLTKESKSSNLSVPSTTTTKENGWFKSLDRLGRRNKDKTTTTTTARPPSSKITDKTISEDENYTRYYQPNKTKKSLRFFGDTDVESDASLRYKTSLKHRPSLNASGSDQRGHGPAKRSHSHRDLHNIEETQHEHRVAAAADDDDDFDDDFDASTSTRRRHKSLQSFDTVDARQTPRRKHRYDDRDDEDASRLSLKPPISPSKRGVAPKRHDAVDGGGTATVTTTSRKAKKNDVSSVESSTEGDSSQQSQKSVVYLHAATVGDIPSPGDRFRKSASREEIDSIGSSKIQPRTKTLSRSFSVLAPWRPKHGKERLDIDYSQQPKPRSAGRTSSVKTKIEKNRAREETGGGGSTLRRHRSSQSLSKSRENVTAATATAARRRDDRDDVRGSNSTLFRKQKDKRGGEKKKQQQQQLDAKKSMSLESLGGGGGGSKTLRTRHTKHEERVSRSKSMPKDNDRPAGWFRKSKTTTEPTRG